MATLPPPNLRHLSHWSSQWNRLHILILTSLLQGSWWVGQWIEQLYARLHATATTRRKCAHCLIGLRRISRKRYTWRNVTAIFTSLVTETWPQQMWRTVTAIYTRLPAETWWQQFFRRLSNCDAPSQLISLVLLTASLELLGFEIRSQQAISIPKRRVLLVLPLRRLPYRAVDRGAFAISRYRFPLTASAQWLAANLE